jgi:hypothetical protein
MPRWSCCVRLKGSRDWRCKKSIELSQPCVMAGIIIISGCVMLVNVHCDEVLQSFTWLDDEISLQVLELASVERGLPAPLAAPYSCDTLRTDPTGCH